MLKIPAFPNADWPKTTFGGSSQRILPEQTRQNVSTVPQDVFFGWGSQENPSFRTTIRALEQALGNFTGISLTRRTPRRQPEHPKNAINVELKAATNRDKGRKIILNKQIFTAQLLQEPQGLPRIELSPEANPGQTITIQLLPDRESLEYTDLSGQSTTITRIPPSLQRVFDIILDEEEHTQFWREHFDEVIQERLAILNALLDSGVTPTRISTDSDGFSFHLGDLYCSVSPSSISFYEDYEPGVEKRDEDKVPSTHFTWYDDWILIEDLNSMSHAYNSTHYGISDDGSPLNIFDEEPNSETIRLLNQTVERLQRAIATAQAAIA